MCLAIMSDFFTGESTDNFSSQPGQSMMRGYPSQVTTVSLTVCNNLFEDGQWIVLVQQK